MILKFILSLFLVSTLAQEEKKFVRIFDAQDNIQSQGWMLNNEKVDFWTFYHPNGNILKKGHYNHDKKTGYWYFYNENKMLLKEGAFTNDYANNWWIFYNDTGKKKIQYKNGVKEGYALVYKNNSLEKAERYSENKKTGEWTSYLVFKKDNPNIKF